MCISQSKIGGNRANGIEKSLISLTALMRIAGQSENENACLKDKFPLEAAFRGSTAISLTRTLGRENNYTIKLSDSAPSNLAMTGL